MKALRRADGGHAPAAEPLPERMPEQPDNPAVVSAPIDVRSIALTIIAVIAVVVVLKYAQAVVIPIVLGVLISYALEPAVARLTRIHIPRGLGAAIVLAAVVGAGGVVVYQLQYEATQIVQQLPEAARRLRRIIERDGQQTSSAIEQVQKAATELERAANAAAPSPAQAGVARVQVQPAIRIGDYLVWGSVGLFTPTPRAPSP